MENQPTVIPPHLKSPLSLSASVCCVYYIAGNRPEGYTIRDTTRTMHWRCRRVVAASLFVLPAVESLCGSAACCRQITYSNRVSGAVPPWTSSVSSSGSTRGPTRAEYELSASRGIDLRMQDGAGYGGSGEGKLECDQICHQPSACLSTRVGAVDKVGAAGLAPVPIVEEIQNHIACTWRQHTAVPLPSYVICSLRIATPPQHHSHAMVRGRCRPNGTIDFVLV